jgi:hypothetical protein
MDQDGSRSCAQFCGYHDAFMHKGTSIAYAVLPSTKCSGCGGELADFTAVYAHELAEAVTDKVPGEGWVADDGEENGDLEAWDLLRWGPPKPRIAIRSRAITPTSAATPWARGEHPHPDSRWRIPEFCVVAGRVRAGGKRRIENPVCALWKYL